MHPQRITGHVAAAIGVAVAFVVLAAYASAGRPLDGLLVGALLGTCATVLVAAARGR